MTRLQLDIDLVHAPLSGTVREPNGTKHRFTGWLGLSAVLGEIGKHGLPGATATPPPAGPSPSESARPSRPVTRTPRGVSKSRRKQ